MSIKVCQPTEAFSNRSRCIIFDMSSGDLNLDNSKYTYLGFFVSNKKPYIVLSKEPLGAKEIAHLKKNVHASPIQFPKNVELNKNEIMKQDNSKADGVKGSYCRIFDMRKTDDINFGDDDDDSGSESEEEESDCSDIESGSDDESGSESESDDDEYHESYEDFLILHSFCTSDQVRKTCDITDVMDAWTSISLKVFKRSESFIVVFSNGGFTQTNMPYLRIAAKEIDKAPAIINKAPIKKAN